MSDKKTEFDRNLVEALAYVLCSDNTVVSEDWQVDPKLRASWRAKATRFLEATSEAGLKVSVGRQVTLDAFLRRLTLIPAKIAYTLEDEVPDAPATQ